MAMKNLRDDGFEVTGFDRRGYVGGLWNPTGDSHLTAMPGTVFNSSRYRAAITDFPFTDDVGDYPTAAQMKTYLNSYCDQFELRRHITLNAEVTDMKHVDGRWALTYKQTGQETKVEYFDKILVATGTFSAPKQPETNGIEKFEGKILHSVQFRDPEQYKGQKVMLVGLHATANDVVQELKSYVSKIYIAHKSGLTMLARYGPDGKTFDQTQTLGFLFFQEFADRYFPKAFGWLVDTALAKMSKAAFPTKDEWRFTPAPSIATTAPLIADDIYPHLQSGLAEPVDAISSILGPRTIQLTDGRIVDDIDAIICKTNHIHIHPRSLAVSQVLTLLSLYRLQHVHPLHTPRIQPLPLPHLPTQPLLQYLPPAPLPRRPPLPRLRRPRRHPLPRLRHPRTTRHSHIPSVATSIPPPLLTHHEKMARQASPMAQRQARLPKGQDHLLRCLLADARVYPLARQRLWHGYLRLVRLVQMASVEVVVARSQDV